MRSLLVSLAILLVLPRSLRAQFMIGDTASPRIKVQSCQVADSLLGQASKAVMKAEVHGYVEAPDEFELESGPLIYDRGLPATLTLVPVSATPGRIPGGAFTMWFYGSILNAKRDSTKPFTVVVDDTLRFPLGMPHEPIINGPTPDFIFYNVVINPQALEGLFHGKKARVEFLGKRQDIEGKRVQEFEGATRLAICARVEQLVQ